MTKRSDQAAAAEEARLRVATGADTPAQVRRQLVAEVRRRLEKGELDSDLARVETALALLDGDVGVPG